MTCSTSFAIVETFMLLLDLLEERGQEYLLRVGASDVRLNISASEPDKAFRLSSVEGLRSGLVNIQILVRVLIVELIRHVDINAAERVNYPRNPCKFI